jgi:hypothetical protein
MVNKKTKVAIGVGAGLAAAGAAAGYYFFASKDAKKNRKIVASWATKLKKDAEKEIKSLKKMEKTSVEKIIGKVSSAYKGMEGINAKNLSAAVSELKKNWKKLVK